MISRTFAAGLLAASCVTAAAGGAYVAARHNVADEPQPAPAPVADSAGQPATGAIEPAATPVTETEAVVSEPPAPVAPDEPVERPTVQPAPRTPQPTRPPVTRTASSRGGQRPPVATATASTDPVLPARIGAATDPAPDASPAPAVIATPEPVRAPEPAPAPPEPQLQEVVVPASSVIGLQVETALSSERAQVEDRVDARVTRDVLADGRVAIPAGSRVIGAVTVVEKGGKVKERARLGVRFHTLVLGNGVQVPLRTEAILREGSSPSAESARKIGGAAIGGAILGAIMGGGKGAAIGGATGAGAGTAVVMAGDRNAATLPAGTIVTVRLSAPATIEVEKRE